MLVVTNKLRVINCVNSSSLQSLDRFLRESGFTVFELNGKQVEDAQSFFAESIKILPQDPQLNGNINWDAFTDSLWGGLANLGQDRVAIIWTNADRMLEHGLQDLLVASGCFEHIASTMATTKYGLARPVQLLVVLVGEGNNFKPFEVGI